MGWEAGKAYDKQTFYVNKDFINQLRGMKRCYNVGGSLKTRECEMDRTSDRHKTHHESSHSL